MIIVPEGIRGDLADIAAAHSLRSGCFARDGGLSSRGVGNAQYKDGFTFGKDLLWVCAAGAASLGGEIIHGSMHVRVEPCFENAVIFRRLRRSNASQDESQLACFIFNGLFEFGQFTGQ